MTKVMTYDEQVEAAAKAMYAVRERFGNLWDKEEPGFQDLYRECARAALATVPTVRPPAPAPDRFERRAAEMVQPDGDGVMVGKYRLAAPTNLNAVEAADVFQKVIAGALRAEAERVREMCLAAPVNQRFGTNADFQGGFYYGLDQKAGAIRALDLAKE